MFECGITDRGRKNCSNQIRSNTLYLKAKTKMKNDAILYIVVTEIQFYKYCALCMLSLTLILAS